MQWGLSWRVTQRLVRLLWTVLGTLAIQPLVVQLPMRVRFGVQRRFMRALTRIFGMRVTVVGQPVGQTNVGALPVLYVANHTSYLDIAVLGGVLPAATFIAKGEIERWPVIGALCAIPATIFVKRQADAVAAQKDVLAERLQSGHNLVLFAEGTTGNGVRILPLKSSLFASVLSLAKAGQEVLVQPITIMPTHQNGLPLPVAWRHLYAWRGDCELAPHAGPLLGNGSVGVRVVLHPPISNLAVARRKELAEYCEAQIAAGWHAGQPAALPPQSQPKVGAPAALPPPPLVSASHASTP